MVPVVVTGPLITISTTRQKKTRIQRRKKRTATMMTTPRKEMRRRGFEILTPERRGLKKIRDRPMIYFGNWSWRFNSWLVRKVARRKRGRRGEMR